MPTRVEEAGRAPKQLILSPLGTPRAPQGLHTVAQAPPAKTTEEPFRLPPLSAIFATVRAVSAPALLPGPSLPANSQLGAIRRPSPLSRPLDNETLSISSSSHQQFSRDLILPSPLSLSARPYARASEPIYSPVCASMQVTPLSATSSRSPMGMEPESEVNAWPLSFSAPAAITSFFPSPRQPRDVLATETAYIAAPVAEGSISFEKQTPPLPHAWSAPAGHLPTRATLSSESFVSPVDLRGTATMNPPSSWIGERRDMGTKRKYKRRKTPTACAACGATATPEWRKGPTGNRTLCNACGLQAHKLFPNPPTSRAQGEEQLRIIGEGRRYRAGRLAMAGVNLIPGVLFEDNGRPLVAYSDSESSAGSTPAASTPVEERQTSPIFSYTPLALPLQRPLARNDATELASMEEAAISLSSLSLPWQEYYYSPNMGQHMPTDQAPTVAHQDYFSRNDDRQLASYLAHHHS